MEDTEEGVALNPQNGGNATAQHNPPAVDDSKSRYVINHRDPLYNRAELSCLWELNKVI